MKNKTDFFIGLALLAFCCVMGYQIHLIPEPACPRGKGRLGQG